MDEHTHTNRMNDEMLDPELQRLDESIRELMTSEQAPPGVLDRVYQASSQRLPADRWESGHSWVGDPASADVAHREETRHSYARRFGAIAAAIVLVAVVGLAVRSGALNLSAWWSFSNRTTNNGGSPMARGNNATDPDMADGLTQDERMAQSEFGLPSVTSIGLDEDDSILLEASRIKSRIASATRSLASVGWNDSSLETDLIRSTSRQVQDGAYWLNSDLETF